MTAVTHRRAPIEDASAWRGADLRGDSSWIRAFSASDLHELAAAVDAVRRRGLDPFAFDVDDFALPTLGPVLAAVHEELERGRGFVLLRGLDLDAMDESTLACLLAGLGVHLGTAITQNTSGDRIWAVTDRGTDYSRAAVRGNTSRGAIGPHCDSADLVALLCVEPALRGGESCIASATTVYNELLAHHPERLEPLARGFRINLAGKGPSGDPRECTHARIPVFSECEGIVSCRYNRKQIEDGAQILGEPLSTLEREAIARVGEIAMRDDVRLEMDFRRGDVQLLNNHCILHARNAYEDSPDETRRRLLLRLWINTGVRPLAPALADRLNTGPRGEVAVLR